MNFDYFLKKAALELLDEKHQKMTKGGSCPLRLPPWGRSWGSFMAWLNGGNNGNNNGSNTGGDDG